MGFQIKFNGQALVLEDVRTLGNKSPGAVVITDSGEYPIVGVRAPISPRTPRADRRQVQQAEMMIKFEHLSVGARAKMAGSVAHGLELMASFEEHGIGSTTRIGQIDGRAHPGPSNPAGAQRLRDQVTEGPADDKLFAVVVTQHGTGCLLETGSTLVVSSRVKLFGTTADLGLIRGFKLLD